MASNNTFLKLFGYILPNVDYTGDAWSQLDSQQIPIPDVALLNFSVTTTTNNLITTAKLTFTDVAHNLLIPYMADKYPPMIAIDVAEVVKDEQTNSISIVQYLFQQTFLIDNITFKSSTNRVYVFDVKLVSLSALVFNKTATYSNNTLLWSSLNLHTDLKGLLSPSNTGYDIDLRDDVFGVSIDKLKRRYATSTNTLLKDAVNDVIRQAYEPASDESLISRGSYNKKEGDTIASRLVGYTVDNENSSICFFRMNTDPRYSVKVKESNKYTVQEPIALRFNGETTVDNQGATIALPPNSSYMTLMQNFSAIKHYAFFNQFGNELDINSIDNEFNRITQSYFLEDESVLSKLKELYVKSSCNPPPRIPPPMPTEKSKYDIKNLSKHIQQEMYAGCNSTVSLYETLMHEVLLNNVVYLNIPNSTGHKVGQIVDLIVNEMNENNAVLNYNLNLAFSGKWKVVTSNWSYDNTGPVLQYNETLSLTRCNIIVKPKNNT